MRVLEWCRGGSRLEVKEGKWRLWGEGRCGVGAIIIRSACRREFSNDECRTILMTTTHSYPHLRVIVIVRRDQ